MEKDQSPLSPALYQQHQPVAIKDNHANWHRGTLLSIYPFIIHCFIL